ncbi:hypothetical protein [Engelhardtia mirabilis]|uniref:Uncharacterized protein n=1 Tax=Engelhardtia mirabilis TaxID=2528011 RepID=A0A518BLX2_9BACT|nr:hypothetical protein Pla133_30540 [Planctomycetes bacterium Pla133]QDV02289.1 hypothetical protein Pla86_30530 [Planctomycetes bacterium Pla86]
MQPVHRILIAPTVALILSAGAEPTSYQLAWSPAEGDQFERRLELELEVEFRSGGFEVAGQSMPLEEVYNKFDPQDGERSLDVEATAIDTVRSVELGQLMSLERQYAEVLVDGRRDDDGPALARFNWDRRRARFQTEVIDDGLDPEEAKAAARVLREDLDCRWLLPKGEVRNASTWKRDLSPQQALELVGIPGMDITELFRIGMEDDRPVDPELLRAFEPVLADLGRERHAGNVVAELAGTRVFDGQTIVQVDLTIEVELHLDLTDLMQTAFDLEARIRADHLVPEHLRALVIISGEGEGRFEWNVTAGRLHSLESSVDYVFEINGNFDAPVDGKSMPFSGWGSWGGELTSARTVTKK